MRSDSFKFDYIGVSEAYNCELDQQLSLPGYHEIITRSRTDGGRGGVTLFIKQSIQYKIREDLSIIDAHVFESLLIEVKSQNTKSLIIGVIYRPNTAPRANI